VDQVPALEGYYALGAVNANEGGFDVKVVVSCPFEFNDRVK
jgi:hypothetical protein